MKAFILRLKNLRLQYKLMLALTLLILVPTVVITSFFMDAAADIIEKNAVKHISDTIVQAGLNIDEFTGRVNTVMFNIATGQGFQSLVAELDKEENESARYQQIQKSIKQLLFSNTSYVEGVCGIYLVSKGGNAVGLNRVVKEYNYLLDEDEIYLGRGSTIWMDKNVNPGYITISKAVINLLTQKPMGYIVLIMDENCITQILAGISLADGGCIILTDDMGAYVVQNNDCVLDAALIGQVYRDASKNGVGISSIEVQGRVCRCAHIILKKTGWLLVAAAPKTSDAAELSAVRRSALFLCLLVTAVLLVLSYFISRRLTVSVKALCGCFLRFSKGDFTVRAPVNGRDEIGILSEAFNSMAVNTHMLLNSLNTEKQLKQEAQLQALRMQINPHFLYNTLDTISWLAIKNSSPQINEITRSLAFLMRYAISDNDLVLIEAEVSAVKCYKTIQRYRMPELEINILMDDDVLCETCPKQILLPLIENAVEHGLSGKMSTNKLIVVCGSVLADRVELSVKDNGMGIPPDRLREIENGMELKSSDHIGLANVNSRIKLRYGADWGITIQSVYNSGTEVRLTFPRETD